MRIWWLIIAIASFVFALIGTIFPIIPGWPFFLIGIVNLERVSPRFKHWLVNTKLVKWLNTKQPKLAKILVD